MSLWCKITWSESSVIPFFVPCRKVWLVSTARVPCSNGANIGERKTRTQSEFCTWKNSFRGKSPRKCIHSVPAHETAKHLQSLVDLRRCSDEAKTRNPLNLLRCSKLANWSQPSVGRSSSYSEDTLRRYCCWTSFFLIVYTFPSCEHTARQSSATVRRWPTFASCIFSEPRAALSNTSSTCLGSVTPRPSISVRQPNFAALNRGRHLYSAGQPSRWALAHILVDHMLHQVTTTWSSYYTLICMSTMYRS